ncbi:Arginyl-tRNA--protein transferase 1 [Naganishia albida]|nr:Arginyl-tRNA--protein transferase 1 [Naganishia albida]
MSPRVYQELIDRGWRRSGDYVYHPDMENTCCPQYTIRLDSLRFDPGKNKKMRYLLNRWKRFVLEGCKPGDAEAPSQQVAERAKCVKQNSKQPQTQPYDYIKELHATEYSSAMSPGEKPAVRYEVTLVPAAAAMERFELYKRYQEAVHNDKPGKNTISGFNRFLCKNPLGRQRIPYPKPSEVSEYLPTHYGCFHQLHRINGRLIAFSVLDILPGCVSSVYFVWDPDYAWASLGKLSALREAALAREFHDAGMKDMSWLYMGYYIRTCQKMRYKGEYAPSELLDPGTNKFYPLDVAVKIIDKRPHGYTPFDTNPDSLETLVGDPPLTAGQSPTKDKSVKMRTHATWPKPPPPSFMNPEAIPATYLRKLVVFLDGSLVLLNDVPFRNPAAVQKIVAELVAALGMDLLATIEALDRGIFLAF